ncbi:YjbQ family protein, partial [Candidatus Woesearchaeota archaeon]|nr:YjbQ family protein [Candidatus Woesearchaeota archaeon]
VNKHHIEQGRVFLNNLHTTSGFLEEAHTTFIHLGGLAVLEDEDGHRHDLATLLKGMMEKVSSKEAYYRHDDYAVRTQHFEPDERQNGWSHIWAAMLKQDLTLQVENSNLVLGKWQDIFYVECDGPRERSIAVELVKYAAH